MYLDMVLDSFKDVTKNDSSFVAAQAYQMMSLAYLYAQHPSLGQKFFKKAIDLFRTHWIDFSASPLPELTESLRERISFLGEAIYTEIDCEFMFGFAQGLTSDLEYSFRYELPVCMFPAISAFQTPYRITQRLPTPKCLRGEQPIFIFEMPFSLALNSQQVHLMVKV